MHAAFIFKTLHARNTQFEIILSKLHHFNISLETLYKALTLRILMVQN